MTGDEARGDWEITAAMMIYGGNFAARLADAYRAADPVNQARIKDAFPDLWAHYRALLAVKAERRSTP